MADLRAMSVLMMNVRVMRVAVCDGLVLVRVSVGLGAIPQEIVLMLVMFVVYMRVAVQQRLVRMRVVVTLGSRP